MLKIVTAPDPLLREVCEPCVVGDRDLKRLAKQMGKVMYKNNGCGLAAPQVGVLKRLIVVDCEEERDPKNLIVLVNPVLMDSWGDPEEAGEGCLSCPGITVPITRKPWVRVRYFDLDGEEWEIESDGLLGRCLQHEIDHLDGKTLFETCSADVKLSALSAYEKAKAAGAKPGDVGV
ncbi:MAG: peptide deformylase [Eggerthellaceae bacterium]|nr:peptide deformylase [Eggerthellaceae bacterium]MBQ6454739.1 peptide deformylase [Eggerthellaceae bacterium]